MMNDGPRTGAGGGLFVPCLSPLRSLACCSALPSLENRDGRRASLTPCYELAGRRRVGVKKSTGGCESETSVEVGFFNLSKLIPSKQILSSSQDPGVYVK